MTAGRSRVFALAAARSCSSGLGFAGRNRGGAETAPAASSRATLALVRRARDRVRIAPPRLESPDIAEPCLPAMGGGRNPSVTEAVEHGSPTRARPKTAN